MRPRTLWSGHGDPAVRLRDAASFQAWFDRILVNVCRDRLRRERRIRFIALDGVAEAPGRTDPFKRVLDADEVVRGIAGSTWICAPS